MSAARVLDALRRCLARNGLNREGVLLAAVSGGADSMALLCGLHHLRSELPFSLHACHVQHGLRGESSLEDEAFVREWCRRWQIPLSVHTADLGGDATLPGMETRARECRRRFFAAELEALGGAALLTAHHQGDQTETLLMHLLRGAGAGGLSGMQECAPFACGQHLRPFLDLPGQALRCALEEWGVPHREDATNSEAITLRNALRLQVLPLLEKLSPGCGGRMAQTAALLRRDEEALAGMAQTLLRESSLFSAGLHSLSCTALSQTEEAVAIRALRLWYEKGLARMGLSPSERSLSAQDSLHLLALASAAPGQQLNLPGGLVALRGQRWLHLLQQGGEPLCPAAESEPLPLLDFVAGTDAPVPLPGWHKQDGSPLLCLCPAWETPVQPPRDALTAFLPEALLPGCVLRTPRPGDRIHPLGAPGAKPLRRWLTDHRMDAPFRAVLPVLAQENEILWIPGLCTAQLLAFVPGRRALRLCVGVRPPYLPTTTEKET